MVDDQQERDVAFGRRDLLRSGAFLGGLGGFGVGGAGVARAAADSAATSPTGVREGERTFVVEQGGEEVAEITPLENGESVESFYDWGRFGHPHSHTSTDIEVSDVSQLFLYEDPDGKLSLVVLHDAPFDSGGGRVTFEFDGLPGDGEWVVRDDDPGNDTYFGDSKVEWVWGSSHTDGGAYRDVSDVEELTVTPRLFQDIQDWQVLSGDADDPDRVSLNLNEPVTITPGDAVDPLVQEFAPDLHFGTREPWFPTDPRRYVSQQEIEGRVVEVVDGFDALDGYTREFGESGSPPAPTTFYNVVEYDDEPLAVVQYWFYSAFDQFVNFHWHDWEVLHVFVDTDEMEPVLLVASAHTRDIPNNEYLDPPPEFPPVGRPGVLSEVGAHASATDVNTARETFERDPSDPSLDGDVTNPYVAGLLRKAYGLPRDEGTSVPYLMPELDDEPLYEHEDLPAVDREDFVPEDVTVRSLTEISEIPSLPLRDPGRSLTPDGVGGTLAYDLVAIDDATFIHDFTGPQLTFEFDLPQFLKDEIEDRTAEHTTTAGIPWEQDRFDDPVEDITDRSHKQALHERYGTEPPESILDRVVGTVNETVEDASGSIRDGFEDVADDIEDQVGFSLNAAPVGAAALLESEEGTVAVGTEFTFLRVEPGDHRLTVNGPGYAPYAERFEFDGGEHPAGVDGDVALVPNTDAVKLRGEGAGEVEQIQRVTVTDDFAGTIYDARPTEDRRFAVYVPRAGTYTVEVTDQDGDAAAFRVDPGTEDVHTLEAIDPGKASLAAYLAEFLSETADLARDLDEGRGRGERSVVAKLETAAEAASRAAEFAREGRPKQADNQLDTVRERLGAAASYLDTPAASNRRGEAFVAVVSLRVQEADETAVEALETDA